ncbi:MULTISPECIES: hypothetical protein [Cyclobacteriaceae]|uniref:Uncharacterized protein n=2 Tax=Cyclobacteriaceae TaxID=563798 RepID=K1L7L3_CECL9|nr:MULTISPECIES: hypothetical protein [Cyclobacteriaceae]EKB48112.1 hypothetical protein B879_03282 [Cecembia lonarensis LW9]MBW3470375.1 hypothetical protein [Arthrospiribacter ruber]
MFRALHLTKYLKSRKLHAIIAVFTTFFTFPFIAFSQNLLQKKGEFKINSLSPIEILDYHSETQYFLGYTRTIDGLNLCLINGDGEIIIQKKLVGEGPDRVKTSINCVAFSEEGEVWVQSPSEIVLLDQNFNIKTRTKYQSGTNIQIYGRIEYLEYYYPQNSFSKFTFSTIPNGTSAYLDGRDFRTSHLIEFLDLELEKLFEIGPVSERGNFKLLDKSIGSIYFPIFTIDRVNKKLFLTASLDDEITIYDLKSQKLESRIKINHNEFKILNSGRIALSRLPSYDNRINLGARNHKIFSLEDGLMLLEYIQEIPSGIYEQKKALDSEYHHFKDPYYHKLILFNENKQLSEDIPMPNNGKLMISMPKNQLLFQIVDPEVEEDFIRYEIFEIVNE